MLNILPFPFASISNKRGLTITFAVPFLHLYELQKLAWLSSAYLIPELLLELMTMEIMNILKRRSLLHNPVNILSFLLPVLLHTPCPVFVRMETSDFSCFNFFRKSDTWFSTLMISSLPLALNIYHQDPLSIIE